MANPEGESKSKPLRLDFDRLLNLKFHGSKVTSDAGLLPYRDLDVAVGLTEMAGERFVDQRTGRIGDDGRRDVSGRDKSSSDLAAESGAEVTRRVIAAIGLIRRVPDSRRLPNDRLLAPDCVSARSQTYRVPHLKTPNRIVISYF